MTVKGIPLWKITILALLVNVVIPHAVDSIDLSHLYGRNDNIKRTGEFYRVVGNRRANSSSFVESTFFLHILRQIHRSPIIVAHCIRHYLTIIVVFILIIILLAHYVLYISTFKNHLLTSLLFTRIVYSMQ